MLYYGQINDDDDDDDNISGCLRNHATLSEKLPSLVAPLRIVASYAVPSGKFVQISEAYA